MSARGCVVWLTGLSGAGKSTVAHAVAERLAAGGHAAFVLDGDDLRRGLCRDLGFSPQDRTENLRRAAEVAALLARDGHVVLAAFISPERVQRELVRGIVGGERFLEVFVDTPLELCERRDPKGLYRRARAGQLAEFTGVSAPYEPPSAPHLVLRATGATVADAGAAADAGTAADAGAAAASVAAHAEAVLSLLQARGFLGAAAMVPAGDARQEGRR